MKAIKKNIFKGFITVIVMLFSVTISAQQSTEQINKIVKKMFVDINEKDYGAILEMTHPKVFEIVPKETMKKFLENMFEGNEEFSIEIPKMNPDYKLSEIFKGSKDNLEYAFVSYDMKMKMTFLNQEFDEETKQVMASMMKMKDMDVSFISNSSMDVFMKNRVTILLKDNSTENKWVMVNYDADSAFFHEILPKSLLEAAKDYKQNLMLESKD